MDNLKEHLESELSRVRERLHRARPTPMSEPGAAVSGNDPAAEDEMEAAFLSADRETSFASRSLLIQRARRLAEALERLDAGGYGVCEECGAAIRPARLIAMPEATTCVRCQERRERAAVRPSPRAFAQAATHTLALD
jgi:RNA polymerase-binding transcription factor DksA